MRFNAASLSASKRITTTGVVFDERASPKPSGYSTRRPSIVSTSSAPVNFAFCLPLLFFPPPPRPAQAGRGGAPAARSRAAGGPPPPPPQGPRRPPPTL